MTDFNKVHESDIEKLGQLRSYQQRLLNLSKLLCDPQILSMSPMRDKLSLIS